jgi:hypothetical protein
MVSHKMDYLVLKYVKYFSKKLNDVEMPLRFSEWVEEGEKLEKERDNRDNRMKGDVGDG